MGNDEPPGGSCRPSRARSHPSGRAPWASRLKARIADWSLETCDKTNSHRRCRLGFMASSTSGTLLTCRPLDMPAGWLAALPDGAWRRKEKRWQYLRGRWDDRYLLQSLAGKSQQAGCQDVKKKQNRDGRWRGGWMATLGGGSRGALTHPVY